MSVWHFLGVVCFFISIPQNNLNDLTNEISTIGDWGGQNNLGPTLRLTANLKCLLLLLLLEVSIDLIIFLSFLFNNSSKCHLLYLGGFQKLIQIQEAHNFHFGIDGYKLYASYVQIDIFFNFTEKSKCENNKILGKEIANIGHLICYLSITVCYIIFN